MISPNTTQMQPIYQITSQDRLRQRDIALAWTAYDGELPPPLTPMPDEPDDNVIANYIEDKVEAGKDFLFGKEVEIVCEEGAPQEAQDFLNEVWGEKESRIPLLQEAYINGALSGQAFLRIVPEKDGSFRLVAQDPACTFAQTAPQDCETVILFCTEYCVDGMINNQPVQIFYREEIQRIDPDRDGDDGNPFADKDATWQIQHWTRIGNEGPWKVAGEPIPWPWPFPPLFSCQHRARPNRFWGTPDITRNLIRLNEALNINHSYAQKLARLYSGPFMYSSGTSGDIDYTPGHIAQLPPDGKVEAVQIQSDFAGLHSSSDRLMSRLDEQTGIPGIATGRAGSMPGGNMSGLAIELLFMSLIKRNDTKRCLYGKLIIDVSKALLALNGFSPGIKIALSWQNPLPNDDLGAVQAALAKKQLGISDATLMSELGYDPEEELEKGQLQEARMLVNFSRGMGMPPSSVGVPPVPQDQQQQDQNESPFIGRQQ